MKENARPPKLTITLLSISAWYISNAVCAYYSKQLFSHTTKRVTEQSNTENSNQADFQVFFCMALGLSLIQLIVSGVMGFVSLLMFSGKCFTTLDNVSYIIHDRGIRSYIKHKIYSLNSIITAICNAIGCLCNNIGYIYGSVSLVQLIKAMEPVVTFLLSQFVCPNSEQQQQQKHQNKFGKHLGLCLVVIGTSLASAQDQTFNKVTIIAACIANLAMPLRNILTSNIRNNNNSSRSSLAVNKNSQLLDDYIQFCIISMLGSFILAVFMLIYYAILNFWFIKSATYNNKNIESPLFNVMVLLSGNNNNRNNNSIMDIFFSSFSYNGYNGFSFIVLGLTEPVSHSVLNVLKRSFTIVANLILFHQTVSGQFVLGFVVCISGGVIYSLGKKNVSVLSLLNGISNNNDNNNLMPSFPNYRLNKIKLIWSLVGMFITLLLVSIQSDILRIYRLSSNNNATDSSMVTMNHPYGLVPFSPYNACDNEIQQLTCRRTIVVSSGHHIDVPLLNDASSSASLCKAIKDNRVQLEMEPFQVGNIKYRRYNLLCLQMGSTVGALVHLNSGGREDFTKMYPGHLDSSEVTNYFDRRYSSLTSSLAYRQIDRSSVAMAQMYEPISPEANNERLTDGNKGNFVWQFGATRMINPYTTEFHNALHGKNESIQFKSLVLASANALLLDETDAESFDHMRNYIMLLEDIVKSFDLRTILLGIGIQINFADVEEETELQIQLFDHQSSFLNEIGRRHEGKSIAVRGSMTALACANSGVDSCLSMGCPSLTISRDLNLGKTLKDKWNEVRSQVNSKENNEKLRIALTLPATATHNLDHYNKLVGILVSIYKQHDCVFIAQELYDKPSIIEFSNGVVTEDRVLMFEDNVEDWFTFIEEKIDFVVSTRIHGSMAAIAAKTPAVVIPTDFRILELIQAMELPYIEYDNVLNKNFDSLAAIMDEAIVDFDHFELNRRRKLFEYKRMLEEAGLEMDPELVAVLTSPVLR